MSQRQEGHLHSRHCLTQYVVPSWKLNVLIGSYKLEEEGPNGVWIILSHLIEKKLKVCSMVSLK